MCRASAFELGFVILPSDRLRRPSLLHHSQDLNERA
jgi:hypothetical protein